MVLSSLENNNAEILVAVPVKNCAQFVPGLGRQILNLDWPKANLRVVFVENDSLDLSYEACLSVTDMLKHHGINATTERISYGFHLPHESRHIESKQGRRLQVLRSVRQYIVDRHLKFSDYIFWIDADFEFIPPQSLKELVHADKDIIIPIYRVAGNEAVYDQSSYYHDDRLGDLYVDDLLRQQGRESILPMTLVNAAALIHRRVFQKIPRVYFSTDDDQEGSVLSKKARDAGFSLWLHSKVSIQHAKISGEEPFLSRQKFGELRRSELNPGLAKVTGRIRFHESYENRKLLFLLYSHSSNHDTLCRAQFNTWGRNKNNIKFFSNEAGYPLPIVNISHEGEESYENMWRKVIAMLRYARRHHAESHDWFLLGGNDLLVIPENLHRLLDEPEIRNANSSGAPVYLGRRLKHPETGIVFNSGGSGYVLNRCALQILVEQLPNSEPDLATAAEDLMVAKTLEKAGVLPMDTRDEEGAERFHPLDPIGTLNYPKEYPKDWFDQYTKDFQRIPGIDGISRYSISFHYLNESMMYDFWHRLIAKNRTGGSCGK